MKQTFKNSIIQYYKDGFRIYLNNNFYIQSEYKNDKIRFEYKTNNNNIIKTSLKDNMFLYVFVFMYFLLGIIILTKNNIALLIFLLIWKIIFILLTGIMLKLMPAKIKSKIWAINLVLNFYFQNSKLPDLSQIKNNEKYCFLKFSEIDFFIIVSLRILLSFVIATILIVPLLVLNYPYWDIIFGLSCIITYLILSIFKIIDKLKFKQFRHIINTYINWCCKTPIDDADVILALKTATIWLLKDYPEI